MTKVYLETFRSNDNAERETLQRGRDRFRSEGLEVSGCVSTTNVGKRSTGWNAISCYTDPATQDRILGPARQTNPNVKIIIKYPQWYDNFHERGYEVIRETADFDRIWVGTETRGYNDKRWGGTVQGEAYFIMRWLGDIGGPKCGGGWYDPYGTTEDTYLEPARQTVLGGAPESLLFCYGSLLKDTGPKDVERLRTNIAELLGVVENREVGAHIRREQPHSHAL